VAWLAKTKNINADTPVRDYKLEPRFGDLPFLHLAAITVLQSVGLRALAQRLEAWSAFQAVERLNLDGLLALWQPATSQ
jgi:protease-4